MTILFRCTCRQKLSVKANLAGKRIKCPKCATVIQIPNRSENETQQNPQPEPSQSSKIDTDPFENADDWDLEPSSTDLFQEPAPTKESNDLFGLESNPYQSRPPAYIKSATQTAREIQGRTALNSVNVPYIISGVLSVCYGLVQFVFVAFYAIVLLGVVVGFIGALSEGPVHRGNSAAPIVGVVFLLLMFLYFMLQLTYMVLLFSGGIGLFLSKRFGRSHSFAAAGISGFFAFIWFGMIILVLLQISTIASLNPNIDTVGVGVLGIPLLVPLFSFFAYLLHCIVTFCLLLYRPKIK